MKGIKRLIVGSMYVLIGILLIFLIVDTVILSAPGRDRWLHIAAVLILLLVIYLWLWQRRKLVALSRMAFEDELCKCPNLRSFRQNAQKYVHKHPKKKVLLAKMDVDRFKLVNQSFGRKRGDDILMAVADTFRHFVPDGCVGRAHDDVFYLLLPYETTEEVKELRELYLEQLNVVIGNELHYQFKIISGHYYMTEDGCTDVSEAIERANIAHRRAKAQNQEVCIYDETLIRQAIQRKRVEDNMRKALAQGEFQVYLQAQYTLTDETVPSAEALVRWKTPEGDLIMPADFIVILEENGFITELDFFMFEQVCKEIRSWMDAGRTPINIAVNFSRKHLENPDFAQKLCAIAERYAVPSYLLGIEITETAFSEDEEALLQLLDELHRLGFLISMDDFGSGYSSLGLLKNLPVDILKIDRAFFANNRYKTRANILIESVMQMAKRLHMQTIAEGVEDKAQIDFLRKVGCDMAQGYYYARPVPIETFWDAWDES